MTPLYSHATARGYLFRGFFCHTGVYYLSVIHNTIDMPNLSHRASSMPASPLRKLAGIAKQREANGTTVHYLNIGQPDLKTPQEFFDVLHEYSADPVAYTMSQGTQDAIDAWRGYYKQQGIELERDELLVTTGGSEALVFAMCAVADPGDNCVVFEPFYTNYNGFGKIAGITMQPVTLSIENGFHLPSDEEIEAAIDENTRALIVCNPSNPTGTVFTEEELRRLIAIAEKHDLYIIADEVYREFVFEGEVRSMLTVAPGNERLLIIDSASKRFNACGTRVGTLVSHNREVIAAALKFGMARLSPAAVEQAALIPVLEKAQEIIPPIVDEYRTRRDAVYAGLQAIEGVECAKPEGAFYIICQLPVESSEDFAKWMIEEFEHEGETVLVAPAAGFYATEGKGKQEIRLAYVLAVPQLERALELLQHALKAYLAK